MTAHAFLAVSLAAAAWTAAAEPMLDTSPTRVESDLAVPPEMTPVGTLRSPGLTARAADGWMVGCETLDRDFADYECYKEYLVPLGIGRIRLQAGWAKCEREKGKYSFRWLDRIVRDAQRRGLKVLLATAYGNPVYPGGGNLNLGGGFPVSDEALAAWDRWVEALVRRYGDYVTDYEMWNEPDGNQGNVVDPNHVADVNIRTAEVIRRVLPSARISAGALCEPDAVKAGHWLDRVTSLGKADLFSWFCYHSYRMNPDQTREAARVEDLKRLFAARAPHIRLWQGESGAQSEWCKHGALAQHPWTELTQAKCDTRRMIGDVRHGVWSSVFSIADICPNRGSDDYLEDVCRYGLLKTDEHHRVVKVKKAYYAVQNVAAVFDAGTRRAARQDALRLTATGTLPAADGSRATGSGQPDARAAARTDPALSTLLCEKDGAPLAVFWDGRNVPSDRNVTTSATLVLEGTWREPVWVDFITGRVHAIPADWISVADGTTTIRHVPVYDAPAALAERAALPLAR